MLAEESFAVTDATFQRAVLDRSAEVPVVVDFWAPWCGPCRQLGPILERLARAAQGSWELAKLDIDQNPELARRYRVQSIPAVKGFRDGRVVAEFLGAQPEPAVRAFLRGLAPSAADRLAAQGHALVLAGDPARAEAAFRAALAEQPDLAPARLELGRLLLERGATDEAATLLEALPAATPEGRQATALLGRLRFLKEAQALAGRERGPAAGNGNAAEALWSGGVRAAASGEYGAALERFLDLVRLDRKFGEDGGRKAMLAIFDILGPDHPLAAEYRGRLSSELYS